MIIWDSDRDHDDYIHRHDEPRSTSQPILQCSVCGTTEGSFRTSLLTALIVCERHGRDHEAVHVAYFDAINKLGVKK